jgi:ADP-ribosyl-[dinitrogen reductase] hydrolase
MEDHELDKVEVPARLLRDETREMAIEWHHLPIRDVGVPDECFKQAWIESGPRLRGILAAGGKIVVHCFGGLGRTGLSLDVYLWSSVMPRKRYRQNSCCKARKH